MSDSARLVEVQRQILALRMAERAPGPNRARRPPPTLVRVSSPAAAGPLRVEPNGAAIDLPAWLGAHREDVTRMLHDRGAVLFRSSGAADVPGFSAVAEVLLAERMRRNGEHTPLTKDGSVLAPVPYPASAHLHWHNENTFNARFPRTLVFGCAEAPSWGGETPLVDSRRVFEGMDPRVRTLFLERGILYLRHYTGGLHRSWREIFGVETKTELETRCRSDGFDVHWTAAGTLKTAARRPAAVRHPVTGEWAFVAQPLHWHVAALPPATRDELAAIYEEEDFPRRCCFGDGSPIDDGIVRELFALYRELEQSFVWRREDVLLVDNILCAHGRNPYRGPRRLLVSMGDLVGYDELAVPRKEDR